MQKFQNGERLQKKKNAEQEKEEEEESIEKAKQVGLVKNDLEFKVIDSNSSIAVESEQTTKKKTKLEKKRPSWLIPSSPDIPSTKKRKKKSWSQKLMEVSLVYRRHENLILFFFLQNMKNLKTNGKEQEIDQDPAKTS